MEEKHVYKGIVRTSRARATGIMSPPSILEGMRKFWGLAIIPGTLNITLTETFDLSLLNYANLAEAGMPPIDFAEMGIDFTGEQGINWARITIADKYPGGLISGTWAEHSGIGVELVSTHHLRTVLNLKDGDTVEFTLDCVSSWGTGRK